MFHTQVGLAASFPNSWLLDYKRNWQSGRRLTFPAGPNLNAKYSTQAPSVFNERSPCCLQLLLCCWIATRFTLFAWKCLCATIHALVSPKLMINTWLLICARILSIALENTLQSISSFLKKCGRCLIPLSEGPVSAPPFSFRMLPGWKAPFSRDDAQNSSESTGNLLIL